MQMKDHCGKKNNAGNRKIKIGLTGGIGSGKTTIAGLFSKLGFPVYIADTEAARLINQNPEIRSRLIDSFGESIYSASGQLDKKRMADIIFNDKSALGKVNGIVHPEVMKDFNEWSLQQSGKIVFFESAILFEAGLSSHFDYIICIFAPLDTRIRRVVSRDRTTPEKVAERIRNQMPDEDKCSKSDFIINTDTGKMLLEQVLSVIKKIKTI